MIFPPSFIPVTVLFAGSPVHGYNHAYLRRGRVVAPVVPFVSRVADRIEYQGRSMLIHRGTTTARIRIQPTDPHALESTYVEIAPIVRALGLTVTYAAARRELEIRFPRAAAVAPMSASTISPPIPAPPTVFTPEPVTTPRPLYTGSPHPRRTPIIISTSSP
ncbi:MAG: hypothetical protein DLM50_06180 [Candidatus Meridianibacter frigidus]|nr:MAG: hypothetical protein DLM50_06180 [Candidatus Eremiobacteraeota bacterium]